jgi:hypothetical protein
MHTEHLQNVRPVILFAAWLIALAVTSLILLALAGLNLVDAEAANTRVAIAAIAFGFFVGGAFAGMRGAQAPILYGVAMGILSLIIAVVLNALIAMLMPDFQWEGITADITITVILVQIVSAVLGARVGYRQAARGHV